MIGYFNCYQVQFQSAWKQGKQNVAKDLKSLRGNETALHYHPLCFSTQFLLKSSIFDSGTTIDGVNKALTFRYCSHNYRLNEASAELVFLTSILLMGPCYCNNLTVRA